MVAVPTVNPMMMPISIVIVNWNGVHLLARCLEHLCPTLDTDDQIIVVDNGSHDESLAWLARTHPQVEVVALPDNRGFAGGNNAALPYCRHAWVLLINNDAFVAEDAVRLLKQACATVAPSVGAIAATLLFDHAPEFVASSGIVLRRDGVAIDRDMTQPVHELPDEMRRIAGASGGAVLLRRQMIDDIGFFADDFFNYLEDVDLAWRALLRGWQTLHLPQAHIRHVYSATSGQGSPFKQRLLGLNRWRTLIRCLPTALWWRYWPRIIGYDVMVCIVLAWRREWAGIGGRLEVWRHWATLQQQRQHIQSRATVDADAIDVLLTPAPWPWQEYRELQRLQSILHRRSSSIKE
ncbi:MAG: glycosyltransferase family 2 protein [Chloroflexi bacterium]|nr:glycosyltransferase family 2 protein [Chloroflexota bacterium]